VKCNFTRKTAFLRSEPPFEAYAQHMMFILGSLEAHNGLPISVNWTVFTRCYGWGAM